MESVRKYCLLVGYILCVPIANYMIENVGVICQETGPCLVPLGFGIYAPSGVLIVGVSLYLRDEIQEVLGKRTAIYSIVIGSIVSLMVVSNVFTAIASASAFLVSESFDTVIYTVFRKKGRSLAVLMSGVVGSFIDSATFLWVAFGSLDFVLGNTLGKIYITLLVTSLVYYRSTRK